MPILSLDHVQLAMPAGQEEAARRFYRGLLELRELPKPSELAARRGAWFSSGAVTIHLGVDREFRAAKKAHPALRCSEYDALLANLRKHDVDVVVDEHLFQGRRHCYISDPFGNRIELIEASI